MKKVLLAVLVLSILSGLSAGVFAAENIPHADRWFTDKEPVKDYAYSF